MENDVVHIAAPAAANDITGINFNDHTFRTSREQLPGRRSTCASTWSTQYDTFVQIAPDYRFGWGGAQAFRDACTFFGGEFVADDIFAPAGHHRLYALHGADPRLRAPTPGS